LNRRSWGSAQPTAGFTLIEVIGALVIFSMGVLMVIQVSSALGTQLRYSGSSSELAVLANEKLDSLESLPLTSLSAGTTVDTTTAQGIDYEYTLVVTTLTAALARIDLSLVPINAQGPSHTVTSYSSAPW
jgi:Tfp pilus assembly protein PilV